ncbi:MAG: flagellar assembly peptidoglycan hydrolase FlgJ [Betaproteobacteria bacterium]|nr:flagellar assembly peptidoglycan hydrolase FlgJ [Betaproteobacteria bacterium]
MKADNVNSQHFVLDAKSSGDLRARLKQDPQAGLKQAAQQFEGMLLQMMLKSMRDTTPQDGLLDSDQSRFFTGIMDQQLAQNLSAQGKLGFAKMIEQQLGRNLSSGGAAGTTSALDALQAAVISRQAANFAARAAAPVADLPAGAPKEANAVQPSASTSANSRDFVSRTWPYAREAAAATGVPAHFLVAHAALESGWGKSEIRAADGSPTYNLFGIKAGKSWQGATADVQTTEYVNGVPQPAREKFRVYSSYGEAFRDYASLLSGNPRFAGVLGQQDGAEFARSLQQSGYATDPSYADKLGRIIAGPTLRQALAA